MTWKLSVVILAGLAVMSCDGPTEPRRGSVRVALLTPDGALLSTAAAQPDSVPDEARLVMTDGSTTHTFIAHESPDGSFRLVGSGLEPGTYRLSVEGLRGGEVAFFGQENDVRVNAGASIEVPVTLFSFRPVIPGAVAVDTSRVMRFTVSYGAVPHATGYLVAWSNSPDMSSAQTRLVAGTTADIVVEQEGTYFATVRATNDVVALGGAPSAPRGVHVFQGIATVTVTPPTPTVAAGATQQLTPEARDDDNVVVTGVVWFWSSSNHAVATVSSTGLVTAVAGGSATITAVGKGTPGSATVTVSPRPAARLAFVQPPGNTIAGQAIASIRVGVLDATGALTTTDNTTQVTLAIGTNAGPGGTLNGLATVSAVAGVATFSALSIAVAGSGYTLTAAAGALTGATSPNFNILPGAATQLAFTVPPSTTAARAAMTPAVQVTVRDGLGNRVTGSSAAVTVAIGTNPAAGALGGTTVVNAVSGVASFSGLSIDVGGVGYTLTANASGLPQATSGSFTIGAVLPATQLAFSIQPASATAGDAFSPAVQVEIRNASGQRVTTARDAVTLTFANNAGGGTLGGTGTVNAIDGIASFSGLTVDKAAAGYTLGAAAGGIGGATSTAFTIAPAAPSKLDFVVQPVNAVGNIVMPGPVTARVLDRFDNFVNTATPTVTLGVGRNPYRGFIGPGGTVSAASLSVAAVGGVATFTAVKMDKPAAGYSLLASAPGLTADSSATFDVTVMFDGALSAGGGFHTCAISSVSGTYCWGNGSSGQLGTGRFNLDSIASLVTGGQTFTSVTTGANHTCGLTSAGAASCWGLNINGQLGNGTNTNSNIPVAVNGGHTFQMLHAGGNFTCGVTTANASPTEDRQVYCWGFGGDGQLGNGGTTSPSSPTQVVALPGPALTVTADLLHTCAILESGAAYCWGRNLNGQLGNGLLTNSPVPVLVSGGFTWESLSAGNLHTCGITFSAPSTRVARCWGVNSTGQLGDATNTQSPVPVTVAGGLTTWSRIAAGQAHTCGTTSLATFCWGSNLNGELGNDDPSGTNTNQPVPVFGNFTFLALDSGWNHVCGRTSTDILCWGSNSAGRLGSPGLNLVRRAPTAIIR